MDIFVMNQDDEGNINSKYFEQVQLEEGFTYSMNTQSGENLIVDGENIIEETQVISVNSVNISRIKNLAVGETAQLKAQTLPYAATNQNISWNSSDESIIEIGKQGVITAVEEGTAIITAAFTFDRNYIPVQAKYSINLI